MIDRSLNYGRHHIKNFIRGVNAFPVIVDLGAGGGVDLGIARSVHPTAEIHAVECWPPYVNSLSGMGITVHQIDIERDALPFANGTVDIIIANQVLEHTKDIFWIFHEISRVLKVGGSLIVGVPNLASLHNRILLALGRQPSAIQSASAHVRGFTKPDLVRFCGTCFAGGFELSDFGGSNFYPFPPVIAKPLAKLLPSFSWGIFFHFVKIKDYERQFLAFPLENKLETNYYLGIQR